MINIQSQEDGGVAIETKGTGEEITNEITGAVLGVYESLKEGSNFSGAMFVRTLIKELSKEWMKLAKKDPLTCMIIDHAFLAAACKKENKDIRSADFDSDEQFKEWFRGGDE